MASNRLAVNAQLPGDVAVRPSTSRKCQNCLNFGHLELIRHSIVRSRREPEANDKGRISAFSKWPVLARPSVAGFARPMTLEGVENVLSRGELGEVEVIDSSKLAKEKA
jgi:hypothetical protein